MKDAITLVLSVIVGGLIVLTFAGLVGNQSDGVGATGSRFPNGISADSTSPSAGEVRGTTLTATGNVDASGEASQFGSANTSNYIYFGAGDGCTALQAAASGTLTATPTSTSFCN